MQLRPKRALEAKSFCIRRVGSDYILTALPLPQDSLAPHGEVSPEPLVLPVGRENPRGTIGLPRALWATWEEPLPDRTPGESAAVGKSVMEKWGETAHGSQQTEFMLAVPKG